MHSIQDTAYLKLNKWRAKILKKNQQKELNLMCKADKKIRNDKLIFSLLHDKKWEYWICKNELIIDFGGQNKTEYNRISIKNMKSDYFFPERRNNTVQWKKDESRKSTSQLFWDKSYVNTGGTINMWHYAVGDCVTILAVYKTMHENVLKIV